MKNKLGHLQISMVLLLVGILFGCQNETPNRTRTEENPSPPHQETVEDSSLKQHPTALMEGVVRAVCYSGFREGQHPDRGNGAVNPSYENILEDLNILANECHFNLIRMYDSGPNTQMVLQVIKEKQLPFKVLLGAWLKAEISNHENCGWLESPIPTETLQKNKEANRAELETAIQLAKTYPEIITAVAVGNEALVSWNDHMVEEASVFAYVQQVKSQISQPVTVADNYKWWALHGKALAEVVDFVSIHVYPLWEEQDIEQAMAYSLENIKEVRATLPNSRLVITEAGWATEAIEFGERASETKQTQYYNDLMEWAEQMNYTVFFFEAFDEPWKGHSKNPGGAEKHWGLFDVERRPKDVFQKGDDE